MMSKLTTLLTTLLLIQTAVALPFGWFKPFSQGNGTAPSYPTGTGTGFPSLPTGYFHKEKRFPPFPTGTAPFPFPTGGYPHHKIHHYPTGTGFPMPTGALPTGGYYIKREVEAGLVAEREAEPMPEVQARSPRFEGARQKDRRFWFPWGPGPKQGPKPTAASTGFPFHTGTGFPTAGPTGWY